MKFCKKLTAIATTLVFLFSSVSSGHCLRARAFGEERAAGQAQKQPEADLSLNYYILLNTHEQEFIDQEIIASHGFDAAYRPTMRNILAAVMLNKISPEYAAQELHRLFPKLDVATLREIAELVPRISLGTSRILPDTSLMANVQLLEYLASALSVSNYEMSHTIELFQRDMKAGLEGRPSSLAMIPTFVEMPTRNEQGRALAMDMGGTNLRVLSVELLEDGQFGAVTVETSAIPTEYTTGTASELCDSHAHRVETFMVGHGIPLDAVLSLGYTFSFPVAQTSINSGDVVRMSKGYVINDLIGQDVVVAQQGAFRKAGLENVTITALCNDTVGTLMTVAYADPTCDAGVILGTGTNACYPEDLANIPKYTGPRTASGKMVVNMEWGNFDKVSQTPHDRQLDAASSNPGEHFFEKMVSGKYLGEVARLILKDLITRRMLFDGRTCPAFEADSTSFETAEHFPTQNLSAIEADTSAELDGVNTILHGLGIHNSTLADRQLVRRISILVTTRSARLSALALAATFKKMDPNLERKHTAAIDGSLFEKQTGYKDRMTQAFETIFGQRASNVRMVLAKDGSGKGAAIIAAVAAANNPKSAAPDKIADIDHYGDLDEYQRAVLRISVMEPYAEYLPDVRKVRNILAALMLERVSSQEAIGALGGYLLTVNVLVLGDIVQEVIEVAAAAKAPVADLANDVSGHLQESDIRDGAEVFAQMYAGTREICDRIDAAVDTFLRQPAGELQVNVVSFIKGELDMVQAALSDSKRGILRLELGERLLRAGKPELAIQLLEGQVPGPEYHPAYRARYHQTLALAQESHGMAVRPTARNIKNVYENAVRGQDQVRQEIAAGNLSELIKSLLKAIEYMKKAEDGFKTAAQILGQETARLSGLTAADSEQEQKIRHSLEYNTRTAGLLARDAHLINCAIIVAVAPMSVRTDKYDVQAEFAARIPQLLNSKLRDVESVEASHKAMAEIIGACLEECRVGNRWAAVSNPAFARGLQQILDRIQQPTVKTELAGTVNLEQIRGIISAKWGAGAANASAALQALQSI